MCMCVRGRPMYRGCSTSKFRLDTRRAPHKTRFSAALVLNAAREGPGLAIFSLWHLRARFTRHHQGDSVFFFPFSFVFFNIYNIIYHIYILWHKAPCRMCPRVRLCVMLCATVRAEAMNF